MEKEFFKEKEERKKMGHERKRGKYRIIGTGKLKSQNLYKGINESLKHTKWGSKKGLYHQTRSDGIIRICSWTPLLLCPLSRIPIIRNIDSLV